MVCLIVAPEKVAKIWPVVEELLQPAIALTNGRYDSRSVLWMLFSDQVQLWVCHEPYDEISAAAITQVTVYPAGKVALSILFLGGSDMDSFLNPGFEGLSAYAIERGISTIEMQGRKGWAKPLAHLGFVPNGTQLFESELTINGRKQYADYRDEQGKPNSYSLAE